MYKVKVVQPEVNEEFVNRYDLIPNLERIPPFGDAWISRATAREREISIGQYDDGPVYERRGLCKNVIGFVYPGGKKIPSSRMCNGSARLIISNPRQFGFDVEPGRRLIIDINPSFGVYGYRTGVIVRFGRDFSFLNIDQVPFDFINQCLCTCRTEGTWIA